MLVSRPTYSERETGALPIDVQLDAGPELISNEFRAYLTNKGIKLRLTAPYTPEMNRIAERNIRTIIYGENSNNVTNNLLNRCGNTPAVALGRMRGYLIKKKKRCGNTSIEYANVYGSLGLQWQCQRHRDSG